MGGLVAAYKKRPVKQPVFDGIQVLIGYSNVQVPSTMNRPSDRLISRSTISPGVCRSALRAAYRMSVLFLPCAFSVSFFVCFYCSTVLLMRKAHVSHVLHCNSAYILFCPKAKKKCRKLAFSALWKHEYMISACWTLKTWCWPCQTSGNFFAFHLIFGLILRFFCTSNSNFYPRA